MTQSLDKQIGLVYKPYQQGQKPFGAKNSSAMELLLQSLVSGRKEAKEETIKLGQQEVLAYVPWVLLLWPPQLSSGSVCSRLCQLHQIAVKISPETQHWLKNLAHKEKQGGLTASQKPRTIIRQFSFYFIFTIFKIIFCC